MSGNKSLKDGERQRYSEFADPTVPSRALKRQSRVANIKIYFRRLLYEV